MLNFLTVVIIGAVCYAFWREGLLTACCMFINVIIAGLVAFSFWEPLANEVEPTLAGSFLEGYEDCLCLILIFSLTLGLLRLVTNTLAYTVLDFHPLALQGGSVFFGTLTGYLVAGFLVCAVQTLPMPRDALQIEHDQRLTALEACLKHVGQLGNVLTRDTFAAADDVDGTLAFLFDHGGCPH